MLVGLNTERMAPVSVRNGINLSTNWRNVSPSWWEGKIEYSSCSDVVLHHWELGGCWKAGERLKSESVSLSVVSDSLHPIDCNLSSSSIHEMGSHSLLWGIFLTQVLNPCLLHLLHWQVDSLPLSHLWSPMASLGFNNSNEIFSHFKPFGLSQEQS